jgi:hypothetical protein
MVLSCPHCHTNTAFGRGDFFGSWVVCKQCEWPFAWRGEPQTAEPQTRVADHTVNAVADLDTEAVVESADHEPGKTGQ